MRQYTYLFIDLGSLSVPLLASFHPRLSFYRTWRALLPAMLITSVLFLAWDAYFTHIGVWGFNPKYLLGIKVLNLPLEEVLFFICIPYACVFSYFCLDRYLNFGITAPMERLITPLLIGASVFTAICFYDRMYTSWAFSALALTLTLVRYVLKVTWLARFYQVYLVLLIPFLIVNGLLTGTGPDEPVVWYNNAENLGIRILTIPFEDVFYGMALILGNVVIYRSLTKHE
ncbi:lycopene cyclase domain-containing protein [Mucilaginibacter myungsuensis]|uniref:Lycopene cyclase domain-containing protein n=1 Tax=Mucilaginibacter myungsuensis TaxID=649104 RepID=A0A929KXD7_9SPHI|nr:lycopene cyclase domain-containing protein [Mucilaginibacter myungsuensis]MBE9662937.1 lycopene cyclase domain-containing protein [Mucilaginibacter myungsuensis]MDN3598558.1 lycopene cyclase domain-containing protein [Mucilaginibacter myungsuensis]